MSDRIDEWRPRLSACVDAETDMLNERACMKLAFYEFYVGFYDENSAFV